MCDRLNASELQRRLLPRSGGQGVAGSNPAVPTVFRTLVGSSGNEIRPSGNDHGWPSRNGAWHVRVLLNCFVPWVALKFAVVSRAGCSLRSIQPDWWPDGR